MKMGRDALQLVKVLQLIAQGISKLQQALLLHHLGSHYSKAIIRTNSKVESTDGSGSNVTMCDDMLGYRCLVHCVCMTAWHRDSTRAAWLQLSLMQT